MLTRITSVPFISIAAIVAAAMGAPRDDFVTRVDAIARHSLERPNAGISIAVARRGHPVLTRAYGTADRARDARLTRDSIFHVASISKNFAAAAVLSLVDKGRLGLDDDVIRYVPSAPTQGQHVTIRQLLTHTSGIFSFTSLPAAEANEALDLTHNQVLALIKDRPLDFPPGTSWRYDNSAFYLAGMVVERVTGEPYATYVRQRFSEPLGLSSTSVCTAHDDVPRLVSGYIRRDGTLVAAPFMTWTLPFSAGSVCATATDLLRWEIALDSGRVLPAKALATMRRPTELPDGTRIDYGMGTRLGDFYGHRVVGHTGGGGGFTSILESFPDDGVTIAVLINTQDGAATVVAAAIARAALDITEPPLPDLPAPREELAAIAGVYDSDEGPVTLTPCADRLCYRLPGSGADANALKRERPFVYALDRDTTVSFLERRGRVGWALVYTAGLMTDAKRRVR